MSRSYKKTPVMQDFGRRRKHDKQLANRKIRRKKNLDKISSGGHYKKFYSQYDICDWYSRETLNDALQYWGERVDRRMWWGISIQYVEKTQTIHSVIKEWKKRYYWK
jgi:hypothetical protein